MIKPVVHLTSVAAAMFVAAMSASVANADSIDKLTYLTFSGRVQVPGARLDAGTYRFRLTNPDTDRNVIQVLSRDGSNVYAMFLTIPDSRTTVTNESTVTFRETAAGVPPAIKSLFYGGEHSGYEFVYPKGEPTVAAESAPAQPPITFAPIAAPAVSAKAVPMPAPVAAPATEPPAPQPELPHTASPVPAVALGGFVSLIVGLGAGVIRRFVS